IIATFRFVRSEKYVRKGLLRLCVAAGITWIGWLAYKFLDALADGSGWDDLSSIVWLRLTVSGCGPILIAWVLAGFHSNHCIGQAHKKEIPAVPRKGSRSRLQSTQRQTTMGTGARLPRVTPQGERPIGIRSSRTPSTRPPPSAIRCAGQSSKEGL